MLEGAVARLLNHLLGKYVVDLDTENLNVGIFSGHVQLTDLKLKTEALYELGLPIEVKAGTIGKLRLQIPWTSLWNQPVMVMVEDLVIITAPIIDDNRGFAFDPDKNKRLVRAFKRKILADLDTESHIIGGPVSFGEHLVANALNNLQISVSNVHIRYEDNVSWKSPVSAGFCIGNITAETTNNKWKATKPDPSGDHSFYLIKIETLSAYWNHDAKITPWNLPSDYYGWRNAMANSLQNFELGGDIFNFVLKPMTAKVKITQTKSGTLKSSTEVIVQDCNLHMTKDQFDSILAVRDSLNRMLTSWDFLSKRPKSKNGRAWWKYAYGAVVEQRIRPYTWKSVRSVRESYRGYLETYKQIISNPNDIELKLDLQKYEDNLSIVNIVIARQQARLMVQNRSLSGEKNFWSMLPSPERTLLCNKIGLRDNTSDSLKIDHVYNFRMGNFCLSLTDRAKKEILQLTFTQVSLSYHPQMESDCYKIGLKMEGLILEGSNPGLDDQLVSIMCSEHLSNSPAYFFRGDLEKIGSSCCAYKLNVVMDTVECFYNRQFLEDLNEFMGNEHTYGLLSNDLVGLNTLRGAIDKKLCDNWDISLNIKVPYVVLPENGSSLKSENLLIVDLGQYVVKTELCQNVDSMANATKMEIEEKVYSKLHIECTGMQVLLCDNSDNWKDERKEKDTNFHLVPMTSFTSTYARCSNVEKTLPSHKFNMAFPSLKINMTERRIGQMINFFHNFKSSSSFFLDNDRTKNNNCWKQCDLYRNDRISGKVRSCYLKEVEDRVSINGNFIKIKRAKPDKVERRGSMQSAEKVKKEDMNEAYARFVDLPGLEDNVSPNNNIEVLLRLVVNEFTLVFSRSSDSQDRQYLMLRLGLFTTDLARMTFGPAYQISVNSILLTDKLHTTPSGQYLDLVHSPMPSNVDVVTVLYRRVDAKCPDFWTHFHGVETSLVADFGTIYILMHQEAIHTAMKYSKYLYNKINVQVSTSAFGKRVLDSVTSLNSFLQSQPSTPVPPGSVKYSQSARFADIHIRICDSDFDIVNLQLTELEMDFLFRANERFVFRSYLGNINVEDLSEITLYSKVITTDEDKVFELKYVRHSDMSEISPGGREYSSFNGGSFKFNLGQIHITVLYKLIVQMHRFIINLEAVQHINNAINYLLYRAHSITDTLKATTTRINLSVNVCGPILLFPQKSSSPNVIILDTGDLKIENFFKEEHNNEVIENILLKWTEITLTRATMTLAQTLEQQEILIEPLALNLDIKRHSVIKNLQKHYWDTDGALDTVQITLGQRDISTICSIYTENIGEGKIENLFPLNDLGSPSSRSGDQDDTVRSLEAFFCEPKQRNVLVKFALDEITLILFFDSGELLSSPIRDLNHGLCKFKLTDISTTVTIYTDGSLDGKLSADNVLVEEIGPVATISDKSILKSPMDDHKNNNNCNITINRAPIVDITFHQNKSGDRSADVIIGRLALTISVPLCEKIILFVLECVPREHTDIGFINHGYEFDCASSRSYRETSSRTVSVRINKPELIFLVETTSNKKRYFATHTEILADYSSHGNGLMLNLVVSLSGLHSLFYDVGLSQNNSKPYVILKHCDLEFSKSFSDEKGKKIIASVSSIYLQVCSRVVHSITDVLNDISEHFKVPENDQVDLANGNKRKDNKGEAEVDLWEPKRIDLVSSDKPNNVDTTDTIPQDAQNQHEIMIVPKFDIVIIFELEMQVLLLKSTMEVTIYDWSTLLNSTCELTLQGNYFNDSIQVWEPFVDPVSVEEKEYKPWDIYIKIFQDKAVQMLGDAKADQDIAKKRQRDKNHQRQHASSRPTTEDEESGEDMMYLEPVNLVHRGCNRRIKTSLSTFLDDSDSENEEAGMEKLSVAISDLFTGDWNESEDSNFEHSSDADDSEEDDEAPSVKERVESRKQSTTALNVHSKKSTYILIDARETLNLTITTDLLRVLNDLVTTYSSKTLSVSGDLDCINLTNDIGPGSKVELFEKIGEHEVLVSVKTFENQDSCPNSPVNAAVNDYADEYNDKVEINYDFETLSSLSFPPETTAGLYDRINGNFLRVFVPNCSGVQTNCARKKWAKLIKLQNNTIPNQSYYLAAQHTIGKNGRQVTISSPLQIKNETSFALSVLYQPSALQELNLEPVGDVTNPFETTMRITVLEAHEHYNVPLYIAYHCKLFIQPAYAEGHYSSGSGIWWRDLATELDTPHNFHCNPKSDSNLETFSLRVMLRKNLEVRTFTSHSVPNYTIHLLPPLVLHSYLPYSLEVENVGLKQVIKIEPGEKKNVYSLDLSKDQKLVIRVKHNQVTWSGVLNFTTHLDEKVVVLTSEQGNLAINIKSDREGSCKMFFYTSYWIINKTGLPLQIKASTTNTIYSSSNDDMLLFTYKRLGKQALSVRVYESNWSNEFGLECSGTTGLIICKDNERKKKYMFFLLNNLSQMCRRLTKIVTLLPSFVVSNQSRKHLRFMEHNEKTDLWIDLQPGKTVNFWPETSSMQMFVKLRDSKVISQAFNFATAQRTVLRMDKGGALTVEISGGVTDSFIITFYDYKFSDAPVLVKNFCPDLFLKIQQQDQSQVTLLSPYHSLLYTWDDPTKPRKITWNVYNNKRKGFHMDIMRDSHGEEKIFSHSVTPTTGVSTQSSSSDSDSSDSVEISQNNFKKIRRDKIVMYWLCYRENMQRVLVFTQESRIYKGILNSHFLEHCDTEVLVSLAGLGVSLFTNKSRSTNKEHIYAGLSDAPAIWEVNVGHKWKTLTLELASWIEDKYKLHYKKCQLRDYIHIDFEKMYMLKPFFAELKRTYTPALYFQVRKSRNYSYFNFKLHGPQIDNKFSNTIVFLPINDPGASNGGAKNSPFLDLNILKCSTKNSDIYRQIHVDIKDFCLDLENDVLVDLRDLFRNFKKFQRTEATTMNYVSDIKSIQDLKHRCRAKQCIIEFLEVSSFQILFHITNTTQIDINSNGSNNNILSKALDYLFPVNMSPYMPMEGVLHRISAITITNSTTDGLRDTMENITQQEITHFLQQYYSYVLGLQVLVNTFAITENPAVNMDSLTEYYRKIAHNVLHGCRCLLGHINMSPAALEQCVIDIFANQTIENIQRTRRRGSYQRSEVLPKSITAASKNFQCGVPNALSQLIIKKENAGLSSDGEMFFRTTGKALLSLVTRHPDEKSDSVEVAKEALRRASILGEPIRIQQRLSRYYNKHLGLKPFSVYESMGNHLLETVANGRFRNDTYWSHAAVDKVGKSILLISLNHVIRIYKCRLWGPWDIEWAIDLDDILSMPKITSNELIFNMRQNENNSSLLKISGDREMLCWIHEKIEQAIIVSMEDKSWIIADSH